MTRLSLILTMLLAPWADAASLRAHVNVPHQAASYFRTEPERVAFDSVITDLSVILGPGITEPFATYRESVLATQAANSTTPIGTYLSSRMVRQKTDLRNFPAECLDPRYFTPTEYMPPEFKPQGEPGEFIDYRQPVARAKLITLLVNEAVARKTTILFTDNWVHDGSWAGFIPWKITVEFMSDLRAALKAKGIKLFCNIAMAPGGVPDADFTKLAASCDGVTFEMALVPAVAKDQALLAKAVTHYESLKVKKVTVVMIPLGDDAEARFLAALAMILDGPLVSHPFWKPNPDWHMWPDRYGRPKSPSAGGAIKQDGMKLSRKLERGEIIIDCANRVVLSPTGE